MAHDRTETLRWLARNYKAETCAGIVSFDEIVGYIGEVAEADSVVRQLWAEGMIHALSTEMKPHGGLRSGTKPDATGPIRLENCFEISVAGLDAVDLLYLAELPESVEASVAAPAVGEIIRVSSFINDRLMRELEKDPERMLRLTPREFEQLVAELFDREGFDVELTPPSADGGRDVIAVSRSDVGTHRYLAECKRYKTGHKVGVDLVRSLYGVLEHESATYAILATTSTFTSGAQQFAEDVRWRLGLKDYEGLKEWLARASRKT